MTMYVGPARTIREMEAARLLAATCFATIAGHMPAELEAYKRLRWNEPAFPGPDHVVVAVSSTGDVHGVLRLLPRQLRRSDERFNVAVISSVCVAESNRGRGLSRNLMTTGMKIARGHGYEIVVLFARRAVDYFYQRFDIWGLASYSKLKIAALPAMAERLPPVTLRPMGAADLPQVSVWHVECYADCFGFIERSLSHWCFLLEHAQHCGLEMLVAVAGNIPIGYAVINGKEVAEIGYATAAVPLSLLWALAPTGRPIFIDVSPRHRLIGDLKGLDFTMSARVCEYGGYMVGIIDRDAVSKRLAERISVRALALGLPPRVERLDSLILRWDGRTATVEFDSPSDPFFIGLHATSRLVGARLGVGPDPSLLSPGESLDVLTLDQF